MYLPDTNSWFEKKMVTIMAKCRLNDNEVLQMAKALCEPRRTGVGVNPKEHAFKWPPLARTASSREENVAVQKAHD